MIYKNLILNLAEDLNLNQFLIWCELIYKFNSYYQIPVHLMLEMMPGEYSTTANENLIPNGSKFWKNLTSMLMRMIPMEI